MNRHQRRRERATLGRKPAPGAAMRVPRAQALRQGKAHHDAGRAREAAVIFRSLLKTDPDDVDALYGLATTHAATGNDAEACDLLARVVELEPDRASPFNDLGVLYRRLGEFDRARGAYRAALEIDPGHVDTLYNWGNFEKTSGTPEEAVALYRRALACDAEHPGVLNNLGLVLHDQGEFEEAAALFRRALEPDARRPRPHNNLGNALREMGAVEEALSCYRRAVALDADYGDGWRNLSVVLQQLDRLEEAVGPARRAAGLLPEKAELQFNLGTLLMKLGRMEEGGAALDRALGLDPDFAEARWNRAQWLLLNGNFRDGWAEYEWRLRCPGLNAHGRVFDRPRWGGDALDGRRIFIHAEQGFGDTMQFVRFLPLVKARGGHVILECRPALMRLLDNVAGADELVEANAALSDFDCYAPLLSLPYLFGIDAATIPGAPYLRAPAPPPVELGDSGRKRIGLVWAGRPEHGNDRNRSIALDRFGSLLSVGGCGFFSLQVGAVREQIATSGLAGAITDLGGMLTDFAVTASVIERLDLVIAVDTAVAHLAGALGKPVWLLLPYVPDWRWMLDRADTPWYPTMRLFRQPAAGDWDSVFVEVETALDEFARG